MTWHLTATGECASEEDEHAFHEAVAKVLSQARAGTTASHFSGVAVNGPAHDLPKPAKT